MSASYRTLVRFVIAFGLLSLLASFARADYTWTGVTPMDGGQNVSQPVNVGAVLNWGANDNSLVEMAVTPSVPGGYAGSITSNVTTNQGSGQATYSGTVSFNPPLPAGTQVQIRFTAMTSSNQLIQQSTTFTVQAAQ